MNKYIINGMFVKKQNNYNYGLFFITKIRNLNFIKNNLWIKL